MINEGVRWARQHEADGVSTVADAPVSFSVPATKEDVRATADALDKTSSATDWSTAAMVYAWVRVSDGRGRPAGNAKSSISEGSYSPEQFASERLRGLKSKDTVRTYYAMWAYAIRSGFAAPVTPATVVVLPDPARYPFADVKAQMMADPASVFVPEAPVDRAPKARDDADRITWKVGDRLILNYTNVSAARQLYAELGEALKRLDTDGVNR